MCTVFSRFKDDFFLTFWIITVRFISIRTLATFVFIFGVAVQKKSSLHSILCIFSFFFQTLKFICFHQLTHLSYRKNTHNTRSWVKLNGKHISSTDSVFLSRLMDYNPNVSIVEMWMKIECSINTTSACYTMPFPCLFSCPYTILYFCVFFYSWFMIFRFTL